MNKLTDEQIIKALEGNILNAKSVDCKVWSIELYKIENALDLIKRQKAEIEQKDIEIDILIRKKETLRDEICELQSEVERLKEIEYMYNDLLN